MMRSQMRNLLLILWLPTCFNALQFPGSATSPVNAYVHIPFCRRRCFYCDFTIQVVGEKPSSSTAENYLHTLHREIQATAGTFGANVRAAGGLKTLYFGGGTPSLVDPELLAQTVGILESAFHLSPDCEITLEMDPGTFDAARLCDFMTKARINRVSLGVQSWDEATLTSAGRAHTLTDALRSVEVVGDAYRRGALRSWSLDLISGLPGTTDADWRATLLHTAALRPPHVSVYDLQIEAGTAFGRWADSGRLSLPSDEDAANFYREASKILGAAGYEHYEVSSFALGGSRPEFGREPVSEAGSNTGFKERSQVDGCGGGDYSEGRGEGGNNGEIMPATGTRLWPKDGVVGAPGEGASAHRSRHNQAYWALRPFFGFGVGATSMTALGEGRTARPADRTGYAAWVESLEAGPKGGGSPAQGTSTARPASAAAGAEESSKEQDSVEASTAAAAEAALDALMRQDVLLEAVMVALRTSDGLDLDAVSAAFGPATASAIAAAFVPALAAGHAAYRPQAQPFSRQRSSSPEAAVSREDGMPGARRFGTVRLTDPEGFLFSSDVISTVFAEVDPST